jgi:uncharacterized protein (TIGR00369 family)
MTARQACVSGPIDPEHGGAEEAPRELGGARDDGPDAYDREPTGVALPQEIWDRMDGREVLEAQLASDLPLPPVSHLFGLEARGSRRRRPTFVLPATEWLCSQLGTFEGGVIAMLAHTALAGAIQTTVAVKTALAMVDLKVNFLRPVRPDGRELCCRGSVTHRGRTMALANAEVRNADGKPAALATGSAVILPGRPASLAGVAVD